MCNPQQSVTARLSDKDRLDFLWDKWKAGDRNAYIRWVWFWATEASVMTAGVAVAATCVDDHVKSLFWALLLLLGGAGGLAFRSMVKNDLDSRNNFNHDLVDALKKGQVVREIDLPLENDGEPSKEKDKLDQWHAPGAKASEMVRSLMLFLAIAQLAGAGGVLWAAQLAQPSMPNAAQVAPPSVTAAIALLSFGYLLLRDATADDRSHARQVSGGVLMALAVALIAVDWLW